jgi:hypothetical protein
MLSAVVAVSGFGDVESVSLTVNVLVPAADGVPEMVPRRRVDR